MSLPSTGPRALHQHWLWFVWCKFCQSETFRCTEGELNFIFCGYGFYVWSLRFGSVITTNVYWVEWLYGTKLLFAILNGKALLNDCDWYCGWQFVIDHLIISEFLLTMSNRPNSMKIFFCALCINERLTSERKKIANQLALPVDI